MFSVGNGQPKEPALCQLHRRTFVPYGHVTEEVKMATPVSSYCCLLC